MFNRSNTKQNAGVTGCSRRPRAIGTSRGQSMVEFAMVSVLALVIMMVCVQLALLGQTALALSQGASAIARYAAVHESTLGASYSGAPNAAMQNLLSSSLASNSWGDLTVTINSYAGGTTTTTTTPQQGIDRAAVTLSYNTTSKLILPTNFLAVHPYFPGFSPFPAALSAQDQELYE
jgi:Flp pilus assembly protein TadG